MGIPAPPERPECPFPGSRRLFSDGVGPNEEVIKILAPLTTPEALLVRGLDILEASVTARPEAVQP
jgi:hypothetical protein